MAAQQSNAAAEYEEILAQIEREHEAELQREVVSLEQQTQAELDDARTALESATLRFRDWSWWRNKNNA